MPLSEKIKKSSVEQRLQHMQQDIASLYAQHRASGQKKRKAKPQVIASAPGTFFFTPETAIASYERLSKAWERYDIVVPSFSNLEARLKEAGRITQKIAAANVEIAAQLTILLVPPTKTLPFPAPKTVRAYTNIDFDSIPSDLPMRNRQSRTWRVFVAYGATQGIYMDTPEKVLQHKQYVVAGYDMRQLGPVEYAALTLQQTDKLDENTWTILYRDITDRTKTPLIPSARLADSRYKFEMQDIDTVFGSDRFRPAVEVTV